MVHNYIKVCIIHIHTNNNMYNNPHNIHMSATIQQHDLAQMHLS